VREYGGRVMTFGEAVAYYRSRTTMVDVDGDKVWMPPVSSAPARPLPTLILHPCVPNPFNPRTTVSFELREAVQLSICLYDAIGRRVTRLAEGSFAAGHHALVWDGRDEGGRPAGAGTYILQLSGPGVRQTRKLMLLK
jgi:hypothetical protein